ncbi:hypothetical protein GJ496_010142, partial [Pomphorhynchus laevis]
MPFDYSFNALCCQRFTAKEKLKQFMNRLFRLNHMDFQYASWQATHLFFAPQKVFRSFQYRKRVKNQWARDDPAFILILAAVFISITLIRLFWVNPYDVTVNVKQLFRELIFILIGGTIASTLLLWSILNRYFVPNPGMAPDVEKAFCLDLHVSAFLVAFVELWLPQIPFIS